MHYVPMITKIFIVSLQLSINAVFALDYNPLSVSTFDDGVVIETENKPKDDPKIIFLNSTCTNAVDMLIILNESEMRIGCVAIAGGKIYALPKSVLFIFQEIEFIISRERIKNFSWESPLIQMNSSRYRRISTNRSRISSRVTFSNIPHVVFVVSDTDSLKSNISRSMVLSVFIPHSEQPVFGLTDTTGNGQFDEASLVLETETQYIVIDYLKKDCNGIWVRSENAHSGEFGHRFRDDTEQRSIGTARKRRLKPAGSRE